MSNLSGNWNYPTNIRFGSGRIDELRIATVRAMSAEEEKAAEIRTALGSQ